MRAADVRTSKAAPDTVLVNLNKRDAKFMDVHRITLSTGAVELDTENTGT